MCNTLVEYLLHAVKKHPAVNVAQPSLSTHVFSLGLNNKAGNILCDSTCGRIKDLNLIKVAESQQLTGGAVVPFAINVVLT